MPKIDNSMASPIEPLTVMQLSIDIHGRAKHFQENPSAKAEYPAILGSKEDIYGKQPCPLLTLRSFLSFHFRSTHVE